MSASSPASLVDPTDVPPVCPSALRLALALEIPPGDMPSTVAELATVLSDDAIARIELAMWRAGPPCARRTAVMLRLRALAAAITGRRVGALPRARTRGGVDAAVSAAAKLRLNAGIGLNPVHLLWAIAERPADVAAPSARQPELPLAA